ncbi:MAG: MCE family protein [Bacteroidales bacterium]|nr:MCE family protein [Bacteroidales bacterium]
MNTKRTYIVAISFIAALVLFIWGFNFLKGNDVFVKERLFYATYTNVNGLVQSNPVVINGMRVGQVASLYFHPDMSGKIIAVLSIHSEFPFPDNSVARIFSSDLMGSKAIDLQLGNSPINALTGDTLQTSIESSLMEEVNAQVAPIKHKAEGLISSLDSLVVIVQAILNEDSKENLKQSLRNISLTFKNLENTTANIDTIVTGERKRIAAILRNVELITRNFEKNSDELNRIMQNATTFTDSLAAADIAGTIRKADKSLNQLALILDKMNKGEGTAGMLLKNDTLYYELERSAAELNKLLEDVRLNPKRYVKISLF